MWLLSDQLSILPSHSMPLNGISICAGRQIYGYLRYVLTTKSQSQEVVLKSYFSCQNEIATPSLTEKTEWHQRGMWSWTYIYRAWVPFRSFHVVREGSGCLFLKWPPEICFVTLMVLLKMGRWITIMHQAMDCYHTPMLNVIQTDRIVIFTPTRG